MDELLTFRNTPNTPIEIDGETQWISRSVTVVPVILCVVGEKIYVPLGKRGLPMPSEPGKWGLPGGYLDYGETAGEAVIREVYEEVGLNIPVMLRTCQRFVGDLDQPYYVASRPLGLQNVSLRFALMFFLDRLPKLEPHVSADEVEAVDWFLLEDVFTMKLAFSHQDIIRDCLATYYTDRHPVELPEAYRSI